MREIKFRAYNKSTNEIISWNQMGDDHWDLWNEFKSCDTIMQFTGLKDKAGVEIYEGDIVKTSTDKVMQISWSKRFASFVVDRKGWMFSHWFGEAFESTDCEVIGNIYQHPNLLES